MLVVLQHRRESLRDLFYFQLHLVFAIRSQSIPSLSTPSHAHVESAAGGDIKGVYRQKARNKIRKPKNTDRAAVIRLSK
jgi:hypothetical protein